MCNTAASKSAVSLKDAGASSSCMIDKLEGAQGSGSTAAGFTVLTRETVLDRRPVKPSAMQSP